MARDLFVTPKCCSDVQEYNTVFLRHSHDELYTDGVDQKGVEPEWNCFVYDLKNHIQSRRKVLYCPHCSLRLPDIERRATKKPICDTSDGGYYCNTCKKRLTECNCYPPEYAWKPVK